MLRVPSDVVDLANNPDCACAGLNDRRDPQIGRDTDGEEGESSRDDGSRETHFCEVCCLYNGRCIVVCFIPLAARPFQPEERPERPVLRGSGIQKSVSPGPCRKKKLTIVDVQVV